MVVKKTIDVWKTKQWYNIVAPKFLGEVHTTLIVPASEESTLLNRVISLPLKEITHDFAHIYTSIRLRISEVKGKSAFTKFIGHSISREYLATLIRRRRDALEVHIPLKSKDGVDFQLSALIVTAATCSEKQKKLLRNTAVKELTLKSAATDFGDFMKIVLLQQWHPQLHKILAKLYPIKRVEITKTELYEEFDVQQTVELAQAQIPAEAKAKEKETSSKESGEEAPAVAAEAPAGN